VHSPRKARRHKEKSFADGIDYGTEFHGVSLVPAKKGTRIEGGSLWEVDAGAIDGTNNAREPIFTEHAGCNFNSTTMIWPSDLLQCVQDGVDRTHGVIERRPNTNVIVEGVVMVRVTISRTTEAVQADHDLQADRGPAANSKKGGQMDGLIQSQERVLGHPKAPQKNGVRVLANEVHRRFDWQARHAESGLQVTLGSQILYESLDLRGVGEEIVATIIDAQQGQKEEHLSVGLQSRKCVTAVTTSRHTVTVIVFVFCCANKSIQKYIIISA